MIDKIPFEIQMEIMKRLSVRSVIQFRSVSKSCNSLISSSDFIASYSALQAEPQHLLVFEEICYGEYKSAIFADDDDDTFPQQRVTFTIPMLFYWLKDDHRLIGSSHGLVCLYGDRQKGRGGHRSPTRMAVVWNPSIRKAVGVIVPNLGRGICWTTIGFGVCGETMDPKIVKITYIELDGNVESVSCIPSQVEVFTLSTGVWRSLYRNLPRKSIYFGFKPQVVVNGFIYWLTIDRRITQDETGYKSCNLIVSFDLTTEEFREVILPDSLAFARHNNHILDMNTLRNSLVVIDRYLDENRRVMGIWMMRVDGVFTKLFTLNGNGPYESVMGFRNNGAPIVVIRLDEHGDRELIVYEPISKNMDSFWIHDDMPSRAFVYPYMETLLLLDQPDLMVYNDISMWRANNRRLLKHTS